MTFEAKKNEIIGELRDKAPGEFKELEVNSRPGATILETRIGPDSWYCERPKYFWAVLDRSIIGQSFETEGDRLFGIKEPTGVFDDSGRFWVREEISGYGLERHFLESPFSYYKQIIRHTKNVQDAVAILETVHQSMNDDQRLVQNLEHMTRAYGLFYQYQSTVFNFFDDMVLHFREFLRAHLGKSEANTYFSNFLQGEMTKEAIERGYIINRGRVEAQTTRGVLYGMGIEPFIFYRHPKFFHEFPEDTHILKSLEKQNLPDDLMNRFLAFRLVVPLGFQVNEEAQYVESSMLSAHLCVLMKMVAERTSKNFEDLQAMSIGEITELLK